MSFPKVIPPEDVSMRTKEWLLMGWKLWYKQREKELYLISPEEARDNTWNAEYVYKLTPEDGSLVLLPKELQGVQGMNYSRSRTGWKLGKWAKPKKGPV